MDILLALLIWLTIQFLVSKTVFSTPQLIECPSIYELMGSPDFNWQHIPLLEVWREKHDEDGNPRNVLESYPLKESVEILSESLSTNTVSSNCYIVMYITSLRLKSPLQSVLYFRVGC